MYFNIRADEAKQCILVIVGVDEQGHKEFLAIEDGYRESEQSWLELLTAVKARGLQHGAKLAVGDGALGFWNALSKVYGETHHQRCWAHKTANVLNKLPKGQQNKAESRLHEIWMAATREDAHSAFDAFVAAYEGKYPKAVESAERPRCPAGFLRLSGTALAAYTYDLSDRVDVRRGAPAHGQDQGKRWRRLRGFKHLADVIDGVKFIDGVKAEETEDSRAAA